MKFEMHCHTTENDPYSQIAGKEMARIYKEAGYDGIVITNHYFKKFYEWFSDELKGKYKKDIISRWLLGYREAKAEGEKIGLTVLPGAEVRFDGSNINDYLLYGVDEEFFYNAPLLNQLNNLKELKEILPKNAVLVHAHPFRDGMTVTSAELLDGVEIYNAGTEDYRNYMAEQFALHYEKLPLSGSDCHDKGHSAKGGVIFDNGIHDVCSLALALKEKKYNPIIP